MECKYMKVNAHNYEETFCLNKNEYLGDNRFVIE